MPLINLVYAPQEQGLAALIAGKLKAGGAVVLSEPESDMFLTEAQRADGVAARSKSADLVAILAAEARDSRALARNALRAALFYDRRVAPARLDPTISFESWARDPALRAATPFAKDADAAAAKVFAVADLRAAPPPDPDREEEAAEARPGRESQLSDTAVAAFVSAALAAASAGAQERPARPVPFDEGAVDELGFPKSPEAMLARWRLIEPWEDLAALESFAADYAEDPYFSTRAAAAMRRLRRRRAEARGMAGFRVAMGALLAGGLFWMVTQACRDGACAPENARAGLSSFSSDGAFSSELAQLDDAASPETARVLAAAERERARLARELDTLRRERAEAQAAAATLAERDRLLTEMAEAAEAERAKFQRELATLTEQRDLYRTRLLAAAEGEGDVSPEAAARLQALEREASETKARLEEQLQSLRRERDLLRQSLGAAERERDRFQSAARDRERERDAFAAELGAGAGPAAATRIAQLEGALTQAEATIAALREELYQRDKLIESLRAELERTQPQPRMAAAVALPTESTRRDAAAAVIVLRAMKDALEEAHRRRRAAAGPGEPVKGPYLSPEGVRAVQACLSAARVSPLALDGLWGRRTTEALLDVGPNRAQAVATCLRRDLRAL